MTKTTLLCVVCCLCIQAVSLSADDNDTVRSFTPPLWKTADFPSAVVVENSALDLSKAKPCYPVDENGWLTIDSQGNAVFEKHPDKPVRLLGANAGYPGETWSELPKEEWKLKIDELCRRLRVQGYDYIRTNCMMDKLAFEGSPVPQEVTSNGIDMMDYWIAAVRKNDLHIYDTIVSYQFGFPRWKDGFGRRTDFKCRTFYGEPEALVQWDKVVMTLLNHVNPYTGLAWKDDPVFLNLECYNEQEICLSEVFIAGRISKAGYDFIMKGFANFLSEKYKSPKTFAAAWGKKEIGTFDHGLGIGCPPLPGTIEESDWLEYTMKAGAKSYEHFKTTVRATGFKGMISNFNFDPTINYSRLRAATVQHVAMNTYFHHPSSWMRPGSKVAQNSAVEALAGYWRGLASDKLADRPLFCTEYNHCYWNPYIYETGLIFPAYSALQGFSGLTAHSGQMENDLTLAPDSFATGLIPTMRANEFLSAMLFSRQDVQLSPHHATVVFPEDYPFSAGAQSLNMQQSLLALLCRFSIRFNGLMHSGELAESNIELSPEPGTRITSFDWSQTIEEENGTDIIEEAVRQLRKQNILPAENITDPAHRLYQSDTGEITLWGDLKRLQVITPRTEGVTLTADAEDVCLKTLAIRRSTVSCTAALTSLDRAPLPSSKHLLLIFNTMGVATDLKLSANGETLIDKGHGPMLLQTGILTGTLIVNADECVLYPLSVNGIRRTPIPLRKVENGLEFYIDTAKLPDGPTPFFEIVIEN